MCALAVAWVACSPPPTLDRPPTATEVARLTAAMHEPPSSGWSAAGQARVVVADADVEGRLQAHVDPPQRARIEVVSRALFGMVGERVVVSLPGDGHVLFYSQRADSLERLPYTQTRLAELVPGATPAGLFALAVGRPPWPGGGPPVDLGERTRVVRAEDGGRTLEYQVWLEDSTQVFGLRLRDERLERFEWWDRGVRRLEVRYDRWRALGPHEQPGRLRLRGSGVEAEIVLKSVELRREFADRDFEVY